MLPRAHVSASYVDQFSCFCIAYPSDQHRDRATSRDALEQPASSTACSAGDVAHWEECPKYFGQPVKLTVKSAAG